MRIIGKLPERKRKNCFAQIFARDFRKEIEASAAPRTAGTTENSPALQCWVDGRAVAMRGLVPRSNSSGGCGGQRGGFERGTRPCTARPYRDSLLPRCGPSSEGLGYSLLPAGLGHAPNWRSALHSR